ncbi:MAG: hypothetical protein ACRC3H_04820 [Lachnospiraceae bacterium]
MNRDDIIRKLVENNNAIPQDLDKMTDDELMKLLDTEQAKIKEFMKFDNENDLIDDNF